MNSNAKFQQRNFRTRMAGFLRAALVAVAVAATWGAPTLATAQVSAPTGATLPMGSPVPVQWTPSFWASPTVSIHLNRVSPTPMSFGNLAVNIPNNGQAAVNFPYSLACNPAHTYKITVWAKINSTTWMTKDSAHFKLSCEGGSITVVKTVINESGGPIPNGTFAVDVNCGPNGPNTTLALSSANSFQDSVMYIPLGRQCTINEQAPKAPPRCRWLTTYPQGKNVVIGNAGYRREVHNRLSCLGVGSLTGPPIVVGGPLIAFPVESAATGSLTILKKVFNDSTSIPPPNVAFQVQVACSPGGPNVPVTLSLANNFTQLVANIPAASACTIAEQAPAIAPDLARRGCRWETSYPDGQNAAMPNPAAAMSRTVVNRWSCKESAATGTLRVTKTVRGLRADEPATGGPTGGFQVTLACSNGATQTMQLSSGGSQLVSGLPVGATCTVTEALPSPPIFGAPLSCPSLPGSGGGSGGLGFSTGAIHLGMWNAPAYSPGQTVTIAAGANTVAIMNSFNCGK